MEVVPQDIRRPEVFDGSSLASVAGVMAEDILPNDPTECRRRNRLYAIRAMDRLGLLGEGNLIPTLGSRPDLRWLVDEVGARWDILIELGRIRKRGHSRRPLSGCSRPDLTPRKPRPTYATSGYLLYRMQQDRKECATMDGFLTKILVATDGSEHAFLAARAGVDPIRAPGSSTMGF